MSLWSLLYFTERVTFSAEKEKLFAKTFLVFMSGFAQV